MDKIFDFNTMFLLVAGAAMLVVSAVDAVGKRRRFLLEQVRR